MHLQRLPQELRDLVWASLPVADRLRCAATCVGFRDDLSRLVPAGPCCERVVEVPHEDVAPREDVCRALAACAEDLERVAADALEIMTAPRALDSAGFLDMHDALAAFSHRTPGRIDMRFCFPWGMLPLDVLIGRWAEGTTLRGAPLPPVCTSWTYDEATDHGRDCVASLYLRACCAGYEVRIAIVSRPPAARIASRLVSEDYSTGTGPWHGISVGVVDWRIENGCLGRGEGEDSFAKAKARVRATLEIARALGGPPLGALTFGPRLHAERRILAALAEPAV